MRRSNERLNLALYQGLRAGREHTVIAFCICKKKEDAMTRPESLFEAASYDLNKFRERRMADRRFQIRDTPDRRKQPQNNAAPLPVSEPGSVTEQNSSAESNQPD